MRDISTRGLANVIADDAATAASSRQPPPPVIVGVQFRDYLWFAAVLLLLIAGKAVQLQA